jgi:hypothetical protein
MRKSRKPKSAAGVRDDLLLICRGLNGHGARYLDIGGLAIIAQGFTQLAAQNMMLVGAIFLLRYGDLTPGAVAARYSTMTEPGHSSISSRHCLSVEPFSVTDFSGS